MSYRHKLIFSSVLVVLVIPILLYAYSFDFSLSKDSDDWADFGSYIGGVYAPILSALTLMVLLTQIYIQFEQHQQSQAQYQEQLITEYIHELNDTLQKTYNEEYRVKDFLILWFKDKTSEDIQAINCEEVMIFNNSFHKIYSMWSGLLGLLNNLSNNKMANIAIVKNRVVAHLDPQMCRTLDKYHYAFLVSSMKYGASMDINSIRYTYWDINQGA